MMGWGGGGGECISPCRPLVIEHTRAQTLFRVVTDLDLVQTDLFSVHLTQCRHYAADVVKLDECKRQRVTLVFYLHLLTTADTRKCRHGNDVNISTTHQLISTAAVTSVE